MTILTPTDQTNHLLALRMRSFPDVHIHNDPYPIASGFSALMQQQIGLA